MSPNQCTGVKEPNDRVVSNWIVAETFWNLSGNWSTGAIISFMQLLRELGRTHWRLNFCFFLSCVFIKRLEIRLNVLLYMIVNVCVSTWLWGTPGFHWLISKSLKNLKCSSGLFFLFCPPPQVIGNYAKITFTVLTLNLTCQSNILNPA